MALSLACGSALAQPTSTLTAELVTDGLFAPILAVSDPNDADRIFVVQQNGVIRIVENGTLLPDPFLDIQNRVVFSGERGLLGFAFHPDFTNNRFIYVNFVEGGNVTNVARFEVTEEDPNDADEGSEFTIIEINQPYPNHNGGMIAFGPNDGFLYVGMGDGGDGNDPDNRAQDLTNELHGKMLRIDVDGDDFPGDPNRNYAIPEDNPFVDITGDDEIWAYGLRNPWRWCFDPANGDMWIADVGQGSREEVDYQAASSAGGENYGWRCMEGNRCTGLSGCTCNDPVLTDPIHEYTHSVGCSITGGFVYRGESIPLLRGTYWFADWCSARIWSLRYDGNNVSDLQSRESELDPPGSLNVRSIASFGQDADGEVYILDAGDGELFKIVTAMKLQTTDLVGGQQAFFQATGAVPLTKVFFAYSTAGLGDTFVPQLNVRLGIANPKLLGQATANASGTATVGKFIPGGASGVTVWLQTAQSGNSSNVVKKTVQ